MNSKGILNRGLKLLFMAKAAATEATAGIDAALAGDQIVGCPFERVPVKKTGDTWSVGLTVVDFARAIWLKPKRKARSDSPNGRVQACCGTQG